MERIAAVAARVEQLRERLATPAPGFGEALRAETAPSATAVVPPATGGALTLGGLLGLPPATFAASAGAVAAPSASVTTPVTGVVPGGLLLPVQGRVGSPMGMRTHPITGQRRMHAGIDIGAATGTPIRAAQAGTVSFAGVRGGYGNLVVIEHPDGTETRYAHASRLDVRAGERVERGAVVAAVGSTGQSTGPHLHFEVRRGGEPIDPAPLLGV
jgi:murein DD-endopeptidase MepM/ murein hydrolase activator NlpD